MRLKSIKYEENVGKPQEWSFAPLNVQPINLLVGVNASGKTRILSVIYALAKVVLGQQKPLLDGDFSADFEHDGTDYKYVLRINESKVIEESFSMADKSLLTRGEGGKGRIWSEQLNEYMDFQPPEDQLAVAARRDKIQHSFLEKLQDWASSLYFYPFGTFLGKHTFAMRIEKGEPQFDPYSADGVVANFGVGFRKFGEKYANAVIADMDRIDYPIEGISVVPPTSIAGLSQNFACLSVKEKDLLGPTEQLYISQGMFRALSVFIQMEHALLDSKLSSVLIDDIGEGLDFNRSCAMIDLLMEKAKDQKIQLIMSTNDRFVMNRVPLQSWSLIKRVGSHCKIFNAENSKKQFDEFKFTGFSNFDFFKMDFMENGLEEDVSSGSEAK